MKPQFFALIIVLAGLARSDDDGQRRRVRPCPPDEAFVAKMEGWAKNGGGPAWFSAERYGQMKERGHGGRRGPEGDKPDGERPPRPEGYKDRSQRPDGERPPRPEGYKDRSQRPDGEKPPRPEGYKERGPRPDCVFDEAQFLAMLEKRFTADPKDLRRAPGKSLTPQVASPVPAQASRRLLAYTQYAHF